MKREESREIRRSTSNPLLSDAAKRNKSPKRLKMANLISSIKDPVNILLLIFLILSYLISNFCGIYFFYMTAFENPWSLHTALPDVISDLWPSFALLRSLQDGFYLSSQSSSSRFSTPTLVAFLSSHLSSFVTIILLIISIYFTINYYNMANIRKSIIILTISLLFKSLFTMVTQLPPSCAGFAHCKCSEYISKIENINLYLENNCGVGSFRSKNPNSGTKINNKMIRKNMQPNITRQSNQFHQDDEDQFDICKKSLSHNQSPFSIALTNALSFGIGRSGSVPRCGGLMMSGRAIVQLCLGMYFIDLMKNVVSDPKFRAVFIVVFVLTSISFLNAILYRDEYTLSIAVSTVFVTIMHKLYWCAMTLLDVGYGPFVMTGFGRFLSWVEGNKEMSTSQVGLREIEGD